MRFIAMAAGASVLGTGAYVGGAFERGEYYAIAPVDVESRLAGMNFNSELAGESGDSSIRLALRSRGPSRSLVCVRGRHLAELSGTHEVHEHANGEDVDGWIRVVPPEARAKLRGSEGRWRILRR